MLKSPKTYWTLAGFYCRSLSISCRDLRGRVPVVREVFARLWCCYVESDGFLPLLAFQRMFDSWAPREELAEHAGASDGLAGAVQLGRQFGSVLVAGLRNPSESNNLKE